MKEDILNEIFSKIDDINSICSEQELENIRIFKPQSSQDFNKVNFVVDLKSKDGISLLILKSLEERVGDLLNCEVVIIPATMVRNQYKSQIIDNSIPLSMTQKDKLATFFYHELLPLSINYKEKLPIPSQGKSALEKIENRDLPEELEKKLNIKPEMAGGKKRRASSFWENEQISAKAKKLSDTAEIDENTLHQVTNLTTSTICDKFPDLLETLKKHPENVDIIIKAFTDGLMNAVNKSTVVLGKS